MLTTRWLPVQTRRGNRVFHIWQYILEGWEEITGASCYMTEWITVLNPYLCWLFICSNWPLSSFSSVRSSSSLGEVCAAVSLLGRGWELWPWGSLAWRTADKAFGSREEKDSPRNSAAWEEERTTEDKHRLSQAKQHHTGRVCTFVLVFLPLQAWQRHLDLSLESRLAFFENLALHSGFLLVPPPSRVLPVGRV